MDPKTIGTPKRHPMFQKSPHQFSSLTDGKWSEPRMVISKNNNPKKSKSQRDSLPLVDRILYGMGILIQYTQSHILST